MYEKILLFMSTKTIPILTATDLICMTSEGSNTVTKK